MADDPIGDAGRRRGAGAPAVPIGRAVEDDAAIDERRDRLLAALTLIAGIGLVLGAAVRAARRGRSSSCR